MPLKPKDIEDIKNVFDEMELVENRTAAKFATVQKEGSRDISREIEHFNLDVRVSGQGIHHG